MHWADVNAKELSERSHKHLVATGITPSGHIHVGNMREILTGDIIRRACSDYGLDAELVYIGDTIDPLRKVYPFLDGSYSNHIGKPLSIIPCPCGKHQHYAEHFLEPFLDALNVLGVKHRTVFTHELYAKGLYADKIDIVLNNIQRLREIIETISKRELPKDWYPYNAKCGNPECASLMDTVSYDYENPYVKYRCKKCGHEGQADIRIDDGKLPWRIDWPARWAALGITCEPFGKDHAAAGGSYDTGKVMVKELFDYEPPYPVVYEWIQLKGKGAMSSSKGVVVAGSDMIKMTPPEVLRFLITKQNPAKHIDFDPGLGILNLVDEYDRYESIFFGVSEGEDNPDQKRALVLAQSDPERLAGHVVSMKVNPDATFDIVLKDSGIAHPIPYRHMVTLVQLAQDEEALIPIIERAEGMKFEDLTEEEKQRLRLRVACVRYWLESFAPEDVKFAVVDTVSPEATAQFDDADWNRLGILREVLDATNWDAEEIHKAFYSAGERTGEKAQPYFRLTYLVLLARERGPRLGFFLSSLEKDFVLKLLDQALQQQQQQ